jgi:hypothetical protein
VDPAAETADRADAGGEASRRERLAAAASSQGEERGSFMTSPADLDRGTGTTGRAGSPIGHEPISRPIVAGPGAGLAAVKGRSR